MPDPIMVKKIQGTHGDRRGEYRELSDGSMWFCDFDGVAVEIIPRSRNEAIRLAAEHPDTTGQFDEADWQAGGDGWVFKDSGV